MQKVIFLYRYTFLNFKNDDTEWMLKVQGVKSMEKKIEELRKKKKAKEEGLIKDKIKEIDDLFKGPGETAQPLVKDAKGQLISKCPFGVIDWIKITMKNLTNVCPRI